MPRPRISPTWSPPKALGRACPTIDAGLHLVNVAIPSLALAWQRVHQFCGSGESGAWRRPEPLTWPGLRAMAGTPTTWSRLACLGVALPHPLPCLLPPTLDADRSLQLFLHLLVRAFSTGDPCVGLGLPATKLHIRAAACPSFPPSFHGPSLAQFSRQVEPRPP